jgi:preprotein translocase subunit SecG
LQIAFIALVVLYIFICFFLILVVLLQQGKGADIAGAFGGGGTQTAFGARGATTVLHKLTTGAFIGFIVLALLLTILEARPKSSVIQKLPAKGAQKSAPAQPGTQVPAPQPGTQAPAPAPVAPPAAPAPQPPAGNPGTP